MTRPTKQEAFLETAKVWKKQSTCSRRQVGAVIAQGNELVSIGYNGVPSGDVHCIDGGCPRGKLSFEECPPFSDYNQFPCRAVHAEANAIIMAGRDRTVGATIYITCEPCLQCEGMIRRAGITRAVWPGTFKQDVAYVRKYSG